MQNQVLLKLDFFQRKNTSWRLKYFESKEIFTAKQGFNIYDDYVDNLKNSPCFWEHLIKNLFWVWFLCFPTSTKWGSLKLEVLSSPEAWPVSARPALSPLLELLWAVRLVTRVAHVTRVPVTCHGAQPETVMCHATWRGPVFPPGPCSPCVTFTHDVWPPGLTVATH